MTPSKGQIAMSLMRNVLNRLWPVEPGIPPREPTRRACDTSEFYLDGGISPDLTADLAILRMLCS